MEFNGQSFGQVAFDRSETTIADPLYLPHFVPAITEYFPLTVYDSSLNPICDVSDYVSGVWTRRWRTAGEFSFDIPMDSPSMDYIDEGTWISTFRGGATRIGRVQRMSIQVSNSANEEPLWTIAGNDAKGVLMDNQVLAGIAAGTGYDTVTATPAETACRHYIDRNCINSLDPSGNSDTNRIISILELEADGGLGGNVTYSARLEANIHDLIEILLLASPNSLGYEMVFDRDLTTPANSRIRPHFKVGTDRSSTIKFTDGLGNIGTVSYSYDETGQRNVAYVGDNGEGAARTFTKVYSGASEPVWPNRKECFVDGQDCTSSDELIQSGTVELANLSSDEEAEFGIVSDPLTGYMTKNAAGSWDLGDKVTMVYSGVISAAAPIIEVQEYYGLEGIGESIVPVIGGKSTGDAVKIMRQIAKRAAIRSRV
jgi:hypothetical protein